MTVPVSTEVTSSDSDGDGICDAQDNCSDTIACNYADEANGTCLTADDCGVCGGDNSTCADCAGVPNGTSEVDDCGVCGGSGIPAGDCDCNGNQLDAIGVCGGGCSVDANTDGICDEFTINCYYGDNCQGGMIDLCMDSYGAGIATIGTTDYSGSSVLEVTLSGAPSWMELSSSSYAIGPDYPDDFNHIFVTFSSTPVNGSYSYNLVVTDPATGYAVTVPVSTEVMGDSNGNGFCDSDEFTINCYYGDNCQGGMIDLCMDSYGAGIATIGTTDYSGSSVLEVTLSGAPSWMELSSNSYAIGPDYPDDFNHIFVTFSSTPVNGSYSYNLVVTDPATVML